MIQEIIKVLFNQILKVIPEYVTGRAIYRYQLCRNDLAPFLGGILPLFPWKVASPRNKEYNWIIKNLKQLRKSQKIKKLLDVGCSGSYLCYELLHQGFDVYGLDIEPYPHKKPTFKFYRADVRTSPFPDNNFDVIIAVSALEHVGLGAYGDPVYPNGDVNALGEIARILSPGGYLLVTVPYAHIYSVTWQRIYDWKTLESLINGLFIIVKADFFTVCGKFYAPSKDFFFGGKGWVSTTKEEAERASKNGRRSVACLILKNKMQCVV